MILIVAIARWAGSYNSNWIGVVNAALGLASAIFLASGVWIRELAVRGSCGRLCWGEFVRGEVWA